MSAVAKNDPASSQETVVVVPYFHLRGLSYVLAVESVSDSGETRLAVPQAVQAISTNAFQDATEVLVQQTGLIAEPFLLKDIYVEGSGDNRALVFVAYVHDNEDYSFSSSNKRVQVVEPEQALLSLTDAMSLVAVGLAKQQSLLPEHY